MRLHLTGVFSSQHLVIRAQVHKKTAGLNFQGQLPRRLNKCGEAYDLENEMSYRFFYEKIVVRYDNGGIMHNSSGDMQRYIDQ